MAPLIQLDAFTGLVLALLVGTGGTVIAHAARSLRGEPYRRRFVVLATLLVASASAMALTGNLVVLAAGWLATSWLALRLIGTGPNRERRRPAARASRAFRVGDLALVAAVALLVVATSSTDLRQVGAATGWAGAVAGLLLVVAAATRGATAPFHRWLPDSLGAPTPSSALLHAGVVNGGAIVLLKLAPTVSGRMVPAVAAATLGALSCAFAEAVMVTRPDVKGQLAWSTIAQMSFTLLLCGLGLEVAAALHLVAHGAYKGARFLGSGSSVRPLVRQRRAAPARHRTQATVLGIGAGVAGIGLGLAVGASLVPLHLHGDLLVPTGLAFVACAVAATAWARRTSVASSGEGPTLGRAPLLGAGAIALGTAAYVTGTALADRVVGPVFEVAPATLSALWIVPVLATLAVVALRPPRLLHAAERWAAAAGRPTPPPVRRSPAAPVIAHPTPTHPPAAVHRSFVP
ncbi:MAG: proton-conducting transporter membrane subunit [Acidimicrobiales bacterium]